MIDSPIRRGRMLAGGLAAAALLAASATPAAAHDSVIDADPPMGGTVEEFPREITLTFSGEPKLNFNTVAVSDTGTGEVLFTAEPELDGRYVTVAVPDDVRPGDGDYMVGFQITSSDGHSTRGKVTFSVGDPAAAQAPAAGEAGNGRDALPGWAIGAGVALAVLVGGVIAGVSVITRRSRRDG
ncbi:hypothetical protein CSPHI_06005 [Corynebacterium sphenisci DSM 44792]|uniref:CopC domain-containing protein n=1 Tax=Corynebacterium sphenisci DSM 44792 TaxID=1437874 RepID=A0A1L7CXS8_9CORY|nr:copper resistance CopC family protein [Corynebacterium sphenisci]APT90666.1 hypothetical protein CSPHI_06005 [Corynebacterium sphenisci DSM 44792]